jgi:hypothetical protein
MSRSSARRAQVEPLAALATVFVLGSALTVYAVGLESVLPTAEHRDRDLAAAAIERVTDRVVEGGVADPDRLTANGSLRRSGYHLRVTLRAGNDTWAAGPPAPPTADAAARRVSVRRWPGRVDPGTLRVEVWS